MPNILGLYARRAHFTPHALDPVLEEFSLGGKRRVRLLREGRVVFAREEGERSDEHTDASSQRSVVFTGGIDTTTRPAVAILAALDRHGATGPSSLTGTFAFAVYDAGSEELLVGSDAFGLHPLFIYETEELFAFATEYEPLTAIAGFERTLDEIAWLQYFTLGSSQGDRTFFKSIARHPSDAVTTIRPDQRRTHKLGSFDVGIARAPSLDEHADRIYESIRVACASIVQREPGLPWALTGGVDTRLIAATFLRSGTHPARFFTKQRFADDILDDCDVLVARLLARHLSLPHEVQARRRGSPNVMSSSFFAERRTAIGERAGGGLVGGELLGGSCIKKFSPLRGGRQDLSRVLHPAVRERTADVKRAFAEDVHRVGPENGEFFVMISNMTRAFFTSFYGGSPTDWVMPYRLPLAQESPFWDARFIRDLLAVPFELIDDYQLYRRIYDRHFPELLGFPFETTASRFPRIATERGVPVLGMQYAPAARDLLASADQWAEASYDLELLRNIASDEDPVLHAFVDFETWRRAFAV